MADEIIQELWTVKDTIAKEADYDVDKLIDLLRARQQRRETNRANLIHPQGERSPARD